MREDFINTVSQEDSDIEPSIKYNTLFIELNLFVKLVDNFQRSSQDLKSQLRSAGCLKLLLSH